MHLEIERKFLVTDASCRDGVKGRSLVQGYVQTGPPIAVRVRIAGGQAWLTIKGETEAINTRNEFEFPIPPEEARAMLETLCGPNIVEKTRYEVVHEGMTWEVDEFHGANKGLIVAEIELDDPGQDFVRPPWLGEEVSGDPRYLNASLSRHPYTSW